MRGRLGRHLRELAGLAAGLGLEADRSEQGATATEYALLVGFIAVVIAVSIGFFGTQLSTYFHNIATDVGAWL
jgi:pilus assembly protein Flp/PilA